MDNYRWRLFVKQISQMKSESMGSIGKFIFWQSNTIAVMRESYFYIYSSVRNEQRKGSPVLIEFDLPPPQLYFLNRRNSYIDFVNDIRSLSNTSSKINVEFFDNANKPIASINISGINWDYNDCIEIREIPVIYSSAREQIARLQVLTMGGYVDQEEQI